MKKKLKLKQQQEEDWMDDPEIIALLEEREKEVEKELAEGKTTILEKLQEELRI